MTHRQELSARLAAYVRSTDSVPADAIDRAQAQLGARLQQARKPVRASLRVWWAVTATAVLAATGGRGVDVALDLVGGAYVAETVAAMKTGTLERVEPGMACGHHGQNHGCGHDRR